MRFLQRIFGHPKRPELPAVVTDDAKRPELPAVMTDDAKLAAAKVVSQVAFICQSYSMRAVDGSLDDLRSDLATMAANSDLESVRLELLGSDNQVLFEFKVALGATVAQGKLVDSAQGVEVPLLDRRLVKSRRLVVQRNGHEASYKDMLKLPWGRAATLTKSAGSSYASEHAAAITKGRQQAVFHVSDAARHQLVLTSVGERGFCYAKDLTIDREGVFVLVKHLPSKFEIRYGSRFTALVISTPRGLQARSIRAA